MTVGGSIALIVIGAILRFAISWSPAYINVQLIGLILMIAGILGLIISLALLTTRRRRAATRPGGTEVYEERRYREPPR
ncbi:MAG: DUF6458 family protein [Streptosporangiaceae bacterium]